LLRDNQINYTSIVRKDLDGITFQKMRLVRERIVLSKRSQGFVENSHNEEMQWVKQEKTRKTF